MRELSEKAFGVFSCCPLPTQDVALQDSPPACEHGRHTHSSTPATWRLAASSAVEQTVLTLLLFIPDPVPLLHPRRSTSSCCLFKGQSQALALLTRPAWEGQGPLSCQSWVAKLFGPCPIGDLAGSSDKDRKC